MFISKVYTVCAIIYPFGSFSCFNILTKQLPKLYIWIIKYVICFFFSFNKEIRFVQAYLIWPKIKYILILPSAVSESIILTLFRNLRAYKRSSKMFRRQFNPQLIFENVSEWFDNKPVWLQIFFCHFIVHAIEFASCILGHSEPFSGKKYIEYVLQ